MDCGSGPDRGDLPAIRAKHRLDAFLVGDQIHLEDVRVVTGIDVERVSDHRPVLAVLTVRSASAEPAAKP